MLPSIMDVLFHFENWIGEETEARNNVTGNFLSHQSSSKSWHRNLLVMNAWYYVCYLLPLFFLVFFESVFLCGFGACPGTSSCRPLITYINLFLLIYLLHQVFFLPFFHSACLTSPFFLPHSLFSIFSPPIYSLCLGTPPIPLLSSYWLFSFLLDKSGALNIFTKLNKCSINKYNTSLPR